MPKPEDVLYELQVKEYPDQPVLAIRERVPLDELKNVIPAHYKDLMAYLKEIGAEAIEPWTITVCPFPDDQGVVAIEDNVVVAAPLRGRGRIESRTLPACTAVVLTHRGPYEELGRSYRALQTWFDENELELMGDPREIYITDPEEVPDPKDYVTEIAWPISPAQAERARGSKEKWEKPLPAPS